MSISFLKKLAVVTGLLVALWVVYLYRQVPHRRTPFAKAADAVKQIRMSHGVLNVQLSKKEGSWTVIVATGVARPVDETKMKTLLTSLKDLQIEEEISNRADRATEYEVDEPGGIDISFQDGDGRVLAEGVFGKQAPDFMHSYFRFPDQPVVYLARGVLPGDLGRTEANYWRSRQILDIGEAKIQGIAIEGKGFKTTLVRISTDTWTVNGKTVEAAPVDALVGTLAHLRVDDFIDAAAAPGITYEALTFAHVGVKGTDATADIRIGPADPKTKRYPLSTGKDSGIAWLSEAGTNAILQKPSAFKTKKPL
jgi:hypothetical protein